MKIKRSQVLMVTIVSVCLSASVVFAGPRGGGMGVGRAAGGGWGMGTPYQRMSRKTGSGLEISVFTMTF